MEKAENDTSGRKSCNENSGQLLRLQTMTNKISELQQNIDRLKRINEQLHTTIQMKVEFEVSQHDEILKLEYQVSKLSETVKAKDRLQQKTLETLSLRNQDVANLQKQIGDKYKAIEKLQRKNNESSQSLERYKKLLDKASVDRNTLKALLKKAQTDNKNLVSKTSQLDQKLSILEVDSSKKIGFYETKRREMEMMQKIQRKQIDVLYDQIRSIDPNQVLSINSRLQAELKMINSSSSLPKSYVLCPPPSLYEIVQNSMNPMVLYNDYRQFGLVYQFTNAFIILSTLILAVVLRWIYIKQKTDSPRLPSKNDNDGHNSEVITENKTKIDVTKVESNLSANVHQKDTKMNNLTVPNSSKPPALESVKITPLNMPAKPVENNVPPYTVENGSSRSSVSVNSGASTPVLRSQRVLSHDSNAVTPPRTRPTGHANVNDQITPVMKTNTRDYSSTSNDSTPKLRAPIQQNQVKNRSSYTVAPKSMLDEESTPRLTSKTNIKIMYDEPTPRIHTNNPVLKGGSSISSSSNDDTDITKLRESIAKSLGQQKSIVLSKVVSDPDSRSITPRTNQRSRSITPSTGRIGGTIDSNSSSRSVTPRTTKLHMSRSTTPHNVTISSDTNTGPGSRSVTPRKFRRNSQTTPTRFMTDEPVVETSSRSVTPRIIKVAPADESKTPKGSYSDFLAVVEPSSRSVTPRVLSASSRSHTPGPQGQFSRKQSSINSFTKMAEGGDEPTSRSVTPRFRSSSVTELPNSRSVTPKAGITTDLPSSRSATPVLRTSPRAVSANPHFPPTTIIPENDGSSKHTPTSHVRSIIQAYQRPQTSSNQNPVQKKLNVTKSKQ